MRKTKPNLPLLLLAGVLGVAASAPVAIRVEVQPQRADGAGTLVVVVVQVSPEDRSRIGSNAMVRIEIDGEAPPGQSPLWAITLEDDGSSKIETTWPSGEHDLRVEIRSPSGKDTGLWVGKVRVPTYGGADVASTTPVRTTPIPEPERDQPDLGAAAGAVGGTAAATGTGTAETSSPRVAAERPPPAGPVPPPAAAADDPGVDPSLSAEPEPAETSSTDETPTPPEPESQSTADDPTAEEPDLDPDPGESVPEGEAPASPESEPESESPTPVEPEIAPVVATSGAATAVSSDGTPSPQIDAPTPDSEAAEVSEPPPVAEPMRLQEPPIVAEPLRSGPVAPNSVDPEPQPMVRTAEVLAAHEEWGDADPDTTDLTVVVMRSRQPVLGLGPDDLELRVGGSRVPIVDIGGADHAPLLLGVAIDLSDENVGRWGQVSRGLAPLAERTGSGLGRLFVATSGFESDWDVNPARMDEALMTPTGGDVAALIRTSVGKLAQRRGRTFLLVLTDGRTEPSNDAWREATAAVESAGVPVLVMALWDDGFRKKLRKNLQQITSISGGRLFMLQAFDQMEGAVERYGAVLDAGVALRFEPPPATKGGSQIAVAATDRTLDITAPRAIR